MGKKECERSFTRWNGQELTLTCRGLKIAPRETGNKGINFNLKRELTVGEEIRNREKEVNRNGIATSGALPETVTAA